MNYLCKVQVEFFMTFDKSVVPGMVNSTFFCFLLLKLKA